MKFSEVNTRKEDFRFSADQSVQTHESVFLELQSLINYTLNTGMIKKMITNHPN